MVAQIELVSRWGSRLAPLANWTLNLGLVRRLNEQVLGFDRRRTLPPFAGQPFLKSWQGTSATGATTVALFADTFNNFYEPEHLTAATTLLERLGARVTVPPFVCCGRPLISKGFLDEAAKQAAATTRTLLPLAEQGMPILFVEPSCYSAVVDDHPRLLRDREQANAQTVAEHAFLFDDWAATAIQDQPILRGPRHVLVHGHCHQKALVGVTSTLKLLGAIPDCEVSALDSGCCGMAGSFGYTHYEISQAIGEQRLFPALRNLDAGTTVVSPGFSCRQQIKHFTGVQAETPMSLLASLLDG